MVPLGNIEEFAKETLRHFFNDRGFLVTYRFLTSSDVFLLRGVKRAEEMATTYKIIHARGSINIAGQVLEAAVRDRTEHRAYGCAVRFR